MRSTTVNKTSVKLGILHEWRRRHLERQLGKRAIRRDLQRRKLALMFLKRAWRNSTKANEVSLGYKARKKKLNLGSRKLNP
ncbi:hypothetical protein B296_00041744 [Ensete ventricosum]|uniref:Uncharacterized protein n=1 Tax=Ensete ventricosum TaxID=4639 RepID=A0A426WX95_ENSVE|nr:hypothetical protein B296_00041744 [Ensete ventricosum]